MNLMSLARQAHFLRSRTLTLPQPDRMPGTHLPSESPPATLTPQHQLCYEYGQKAVTTKQSGRISTAYQRRSDFATVSDFVVAPVTALENSLVCN